MFTTPSSILEKHYLPYMHCGDRDEPLAPHGLLSLRNIPAPALPGLLSSLLAFISQSISLLSRPQGTIMVYFCEKVSVCDIFLISTKYHTASVSDCTLLQSMKFANRVFIIQWGFVFVYGQGWCFFSKIHHNLVLLKIRILLTL